MEKPTMKREVAIQSVFNSQGLQPSIVFYASPDAVYEFQVFGEIMPWGSGYKLFVDPRYDFDEVVKYIENYG